MKKDDLLFIGQPPWRCAIDLSKVTSVIFQPDTAIVNFCDGAKSLTVYQAQAIQDLTAALDGK